VQADGQYSPACSLLVYIASSGWLSWACSSKTGEFHRFTVMIWVSRVSVRIRVSLVLVIGWG